MIEIAYLVDYPDVIPTLVQWFRAQWPDYYAHRTPTVIAQDFYEEANRNGLPVRLVAFADGELAGTVTLRERAFQVFPEYHPGLGGLFVEEQYRGCGIGTELVKAGMKVAREQGYQTIYTTTVTASSILEHLGWKWLRNISHENEHVGLYSFEINA
jgi:GNAT superfamily N-acetyltransferase